MRGPENVKFITYNKTFFYNNVTLAQAWLDRNMRVCGILRSNRGIPYDQQGKANACGKGSQRSGGKVTMVQVWKDKRLVQMINTIHDTTTVNTGRKEKKTNMEMKMSFAIDQYSKFMKGIDKADQYVSYYSVLTKTVKCLKKVVLYLLNCALFNAIFWYWTLTAILLYEVSAVLGSGA